MSSYQYPDDTPSRQLAGASRTGRQLQRQGRVQTLKPYSRPSSLSTATAASSGSNGIAASEFGRSSAAKSTSAAVTTPEPPRRGGLLSSLGRAIAKPISWLSAASGGGPQSDPRLPSSSSLPALPPPHASQGLVARQRPPEGNTAAGSGRLSGGASSAAIEVGRRLAASVRPRLSGESNEDIEAHDSSIGRAEAGLSTSASMPAQFRRSAGSSFGAPSPSVRREQLSVPYTPGAPPRRVPGSHSALHLGPDDAARRFPSRSPSPAVSSADIAAYRSRMSTGTARSVREGSVAQSSASPRPFVYGFGSERRLGSSASAYGGSPAGGPSAFHLPSRSPLARSVGRASLGNGYAASEVAGDRSLSNSPFAPRIRSGSVQPGLGLRRSNGSMYAPSAASGAGSRAGSVFGGSTTSMTPKRRDWSSLNINLNPTRDQSDGEQLMREYARLQSGASVAATPPSRAGSVVRQSPNPVTGWLGKREASMELDDRDTRSNASHSGRKRTMVWHPELGFISQETLRAKEPKLPPPKNDAEAILQALESMRTPLGDVRKEGQIRSATPSRHMTTVPVPAPFPDRSAPSSSSRMRAERAGSEMSNHSGSVAPYSRAMRRRGESVASKHEESGMRAKLKRDPSIARESPAPQRHSSSAKRSHLSRADVNGMDEDTITRNDKSPAKAPPPPAPSKDEEMQIDEIAPRRSTRGMTTRARARQAAAAPQETQESSPRATAKAKDKGKSRASEPAPVEAPVVAESVPSSSTQVQQDKGGTIEAEQSEPQSEPRKDRFTVRADTPGSQGSTRSTLRVGAAKTQRQHTSAGRIALDNDDDDDDENMPDTSELDKIKLPVMFPTGFKFGDAATKASTSAQEAKPEEDGSRKALTTNEASKSATPVEKESTFTTVPSSSAPSLLSRLGPPPAASAPPSFSFEAANPPKVSSPSPAPASPSPVASATEKAEKTPPPDKPAFTFTPLTKGDDSGTSAAKPLAPALSFFAPPANSGSTSAKVDNEKKSGPVPNFFGAAASKPSESSAEKAPLPSFGAPAATGAFSFGAPAQHADAPASTATPNPFAAKAASAAPTTSGFTFVAPSTTTEKRKSSEDDAQEPPQKKTAASGFAFPAPTVASAGAKPAPFSFEAPATAPASPAPFTFGAGIASEAKAQTPSTSTPIPNFFGKASSDFGAASTAPSFGTPKPVTASFSNDTPKSTGDADGEMMEESPKAPLKPKDSAPLPMFSFASAGISAPQTKPFPFGQPSQTSTGPKFGSDNNPSSPALQSPNFSFGTAAQSGSSSGGFGSPQVASPNGNGSATANPGFSFTAPASSPFGSSFPQSTQPSQPQQATSPFAFGTPTGSGTNTPSNGAFVFGTSNQAPQQPGTPSTGFTFSMPAAAGGFGAPTPPVNTAGAGSFSFGANPSGVATAAPFQFGSGAQPPQSPTPFQFGPPAGVAPSQPQQQGMPSLGTPPPQPAGPQLFTMGTAGSTPASGRTIRSLPRSRKR